MLRHTRNTANRFISRFTMNNIAPKLQKCWTHKIAFKIISKMLKQPNFFYSQPSTLSKDAPARFYLSTTFDLSFMTSSVSPTRSSTSYTYLITKIGNLKLKQHLITEFGKITRSFVSNAYKQQMIDKSFPDQQKGMAEELLTLNLQKLLSFSFGSRGPSHLIFYHPLGRKFQIRSDFLSRMSNDQRLKEN